MLKKLAMAACVAMLTGCSTKWLPDADSPINPPVAFQQEFIADALDDVFKSMNFARLKGKVVDIEVMGVYADGDIADYLRAKLQLELAKAGALSEVDSLDRDVDYKANIMLRHGGVNDIVKSAVFYQWREKVYDYDVQVAVFDVKGGHYFVQSGKGASSAVVARKFYLLFFPLPLPNEWSTTKGTNIYSQMSETYDAAKRVKNDRSLMYDRSQIPKTFGQ